jgi:hypothetical protein
VAWIGRLVLAASALVENARMIDAHPRRGEFRQRIRA